MRVPPLWLTRPAIPALGWLTARYIAKQRQRFLPDARAIRDDHKRRLRGFFTDDLLDSVRVVRGEVPSSWFYPLVRPLGLKDLPEMSGIGAITFVDLVVYPERLDLDTLFHELVHVVQYRALGLERFARLYVDGFLRGGSYEAIPLEQQAYALGERFERARRHGFSVEADVRQRSNAGRF
jgi:hypothetical protein